MRSDDLIRVLGGVPGTEVSTTAGVVTAYVPAIDDAVRLSPDDVLATERITSPTGAPAVQLGIRRGHQELPLIVTVDDVVFMPAYAADMVQPGASILVPSTPDLIAYSEMHRDVRALGRAVQQGDRDFDGETLEATLLAHRCFLAGAVRVGLWPVRVAAWWEFSWSRVGVGSQLPPFRPDPAWDALMADVTEARRRTATTRDPAHL
jgi:hypothetical protein